MGRNIVNQSPELNRDEILKEINVLRYIASLNFIFIDCTYSRYEKIELCAHQIHLYIYLNTYRTSTSIYDIVPQLVTNYIL